MQRNLVFPVRLFLLMGIACLAPSFPAGAQAANETLKGMLAAQIRTQGFVCDRPLRAKRDARDSRPDYGTWVLRCSNATYRISRAPDMAARVQPLQ